MAEEKILKPKSFRIDEDTSNKFKEIAISTGGNQQETMQLLINAYYMQKQKVELVEHKASLDEFERYITSLITMYTQALQNNHDMKDTVMQEFDALLKSKDAVIQDLQGKMITLEQMKANATATAKYHAEENEKLKKQIDESIDEYEARIADMQSMLMDKDNLNKALTDSCNDLKVKVEETGNAPAQLKEVEMEIRDLKAEYNGLLKDYENLKKRLQKEKEDFEKQAEQSTLSYEEKITTLQQAHTVTLEQQKQQAQILLDKSVLEIERTYQQKIEELKVSKQSEIDKYQQKYFNLLEKMDKETK
jgi:chromosome segregation ATPase